MSNEEILEFLYDDKNIMNCEKCPYNSGQRPTLEHVGPCLQQHCWVSLHCRKGGKDE